MNRWLVKTEPEAWSWSDQLAAKNRTTAWDGVRNAQAIKHLKAMKAGDEVLFYHSGDERQVVGIARVVGEHRPDPSDSGGRSVAVDLRAVEPLPRPVTLAQIKAEPRLRHLPLLRQPRLSVMPVDEQSWTLIRKLGSSG